MSANFWAVLDGLIAACPLVIDRPRGSAHPRHPELTYPLDYGYLDGTSAGDGHGIDVWLGSGAERHLNAIICTADLDKRDAEIKLLLGCTEADISAIESFLHTPGRFGNMVLSRKEASHA